MWLNCAAYCNVGQKLACFHTQWNENDDIVTENYVEFLFYISERKQEEFTSFEKTPQLCDFQVFTFRKKNIL